MVEFIPSEKLLDGIKKVCGSAREEVLICSAWLTTGGVKRILENLPNRTLNIKILVRVSELDDLQITSSKVFAYLNRFRDTYNIEYAFHSNLHAKFIVVDKTYALLGSANFTYSGIEPEGGNIEAAVLLDDPREIQKLREFFYEIWQSKLGQGEVFTPDDDIVGFIVNPTKSGSIEAILLQDAEVNEGEFIVFSDYGRKYLAVVKSVVGWDTAFFLNPFTQGDHPLFPSTGDFKRIFGEQKVREWQVAALYSLIQQSSYIRTVSATVLGYFQSGKLMPSLTAVKVGLPVRKAKKGDLSWVPGICIGNYINSNIPAVIDLEEVRRKHMAVLGTTGSGKSYFTKRFVERALEHLSTVYILDPHGEYSDLNTDVYQVELENTLFFVDPDKLIDMLAGYGASVKGSSTIAKENKVKLTRWVHSLLAGSPQESLQDILDKIAKECIPFLSEEYGEKALSNQEDILRKIEESLTRNGAVVFDFRKVDDPVIRCELAGYILRRLFIQAKKNEDMNSMVVLEEAHNFAPERGYGDVSAGKENLAKTYSLKIASEGRKFGLGIIAVSQRPAQVSKALLSQANTQVLFRMVNKSDIDAVENAIETVSRDVVTKLPDLRTGYAFVTGVGVQFPALVEIQ